MPTNKKLLILAGDGIGPEVMRAGEPRHRLARQEARGVVRCRRGTGRRLLARQAWRAVDRCVDGQGDEGRRGAARRRRRTEMGQSALREEAGARPAAPAQGHGAVRQSAAGAGVRRAGRRLDPEARSGARARPHDRARAHRRRLFRLAARHRDAARRLAPGHQHPGLYDGGDRPRRPRRVRARAQAQAQALLGREGECDGERRALARGSDQAARRIQGRRAVATCTPTTAPCSWCASPSSST